MFIPRFYRNRRDITEIKKLLFGNSQNTVNSCTHKSKEVISPYIDKKECSWISYFISLHSSVSKDTKVLKMKLDH